MRLLLLLLCVLCLLACGHEESNSVVEPEDYMYSLWVHTADPVFYPDWYCTLDWMDNGRVAHSETIKPLPQGAVSTIFNGPDPAGYTTICRVYYRNGSLLDTVTVDWVWSGYLLFGDVTVTAPKGE